MVPFAVTYHSSLNYLHKNNTFNTYLLNTNGEVKNIFFPGPVVSCISARKLNTYLVMPTPPKYDLKTAVKIIVTFVIICDIFTNIVTGKSFKINHLLNCRNRCIIYLLICK